MDRTPSLSLHPARWFDAWWLYRCRNHPSTRVMMIEQMPLGWWQHVAWLSATLRSTSQRRLFIARSTCCHRPLGLGRLDLTGAGKADLSIAVSPEHRGHGYGREIIDALVAEARSIGCVQCRADIRPENSASIRSFEQAGFFYVGGVGRVVRSGELVRMALRCQ